MTHLDALPGVAIGIVTSNGDPQGAGRVQVRFSTPSGSVEEVWARVLTSVPLPEERDTVVLAFEHGQPDRPLVLGGL